MVITTFKIEDLWEQYFENVDLSHDGSVNFEEWITAACDKKILLKKDNIKRVFKFLGGVDNYLEVATFRSKMPSRNRNNMKPEDMTNSSESSATLVCDVHYDK